MRPDGRGLPAGRGTVKQGEQLFTERCASCHGEFGQGAGRLSALAGGHGTLKADRPDKTIGSFWPDLSTVYDYVKRTMPYGNARSLTDDETYALVAFLLNLNNLVKDEDFELNDRNFTSIRMPNGNGFFGDDRESVGKEVLEREALHEQLPRRSQDHRQGDLDRRHARREIGTQGGLIPLAFPLNRPRAHDASLRRRWKNPTGGRRRLRTQAALRVVFAT